MAGSVKARSLAGATSGDQIVFERTPALEPPFPITCLMLFRAPGATGNFQHCVSKHLIAGEHSSYGFNTSGAAGIRFNVGWGTGAGDATYSPVDSTIHDNGSWHLIGGTYDGASVRLWIDGAQIGSGTADTHAILYQADAIDDLFLGTFDSSQNFGMNCEIAMFGLWARMLGGPEQLKLGRSLQRLLASKPRALYLLDQLATTQAVRDLSSHGSHQSSLAGSSVVNGDLTVDWCRYHPVLPRVAKAAAGAPATGWEVGAIPLSA